MGIIHRISNTLDRISQVFVQIALAIIVILFLAEAFARNVLRTSLIWVDEVSVTFLGTWFVFIGAAHAMKVGLLISFEALLPRLPRPLRSAAFFVTQAFILLFLMVIIVFGSRLALFTMSQPSAALQWPMGLAYSGVVAGCVLMVIHTVAGILSKVRNEGTQ
jgi:TRAP-type C4-dicarboxylate transport system permease small subunit